MAGPSYVETRRERGRQTLPILNGALTDFILRWMISFKGAIWLQRWER